MMEIVQCYGTVQIREGEINENKRRKLCRKPVMITVMKCGDKLCVHVNTRPEIESCDAARSFSG